MKKILLLGLNARYSHSNPAIYSLRTAVADPYMPETLEMSVNSPFNIIMSEIMKRKPDVVALSVYIWNAALIRQVIKNLGELAPGVVVIAGGPEVSYTAEEWLAEFPNLNFAISGPGEASLRHLSLHDFILPRGVVSIPNPPFSEIPFAYRDDDFPALSGKYLYYESSRGCPFRCTYCLSSRADIKLEFREMEMVKRELKWLVARNPPVIKFVDRTFNIRPSHSRAIWSHIIDTFRNGRTTFHFEIMASLLTGEDMEILSFAPPGLFQLEAGIQSVHNATLEKIRRKDDPDRAIANLVNIGSHGTIHLHCDIMAGLPGEKPDDIRESFNRVYAAHPDHLQLGFLKVLHGTAIRETADDLGIRFSTEPPFEVISTPGMSETDLNLLRKIAGLVEKLRNENPFPEALGHLEKMYTSPFDLFMELALYSPGGKTDLPRAWEACGEFLLNYTTDRHPDNVPLMRDCLRWDWCTRGKSHRYPPFLCAEITRRARHEGLMLTENHDTQGDVDRHDHIFFIAETDVFRNKNMNANMIRSFRITGNPRPGKTHVT